MKLLTLAILGFCWLSPLRAGILYRVQVDTSSIATLDGFLDFQFNAGGSPADAAFADIENFVFNGTLGTAFPFGDVSGSLPGVVAISNSGAFNDLFQAVTFGSNLSFLVRLGGDAVNAPTPGSALSAFGFGIFADDGITPLLTNDPFGFAFTIQLQPDGDGVEDVQGTTTSAQAVPEPRTTALVAIALAALIACVAPKRR